MSRSPLVFPNPSALGLGAVLLAMWYAGASQNNGAAYLLCFALTALAVVSVPNTWANLRRISVKADPIRPVFAGERMKVGLVITTDAKRPRYSVSVQLGRKGTPVLIGQVQPTAPIRVELDAPALDRGIYRTIQVSLKSEFPFGFFTALRTFTVQQSYAVYPKPEGDYPLPSFAERARNTQDGSKSEGDDYAGVKSWVPGESMRHIDWKAVSRGQPLMTKQWASESGRRLILKWDQLPHLETEARIRQLTRWVLLAENQALEYGLDIPGASIAPARGEAHFHRCLRLFATFPADSTRAKI